MTKDILHLDYTGTGDLNQIPAPLHLSITIPPNDPVRLLSRFIDEMDLSALYETYTSDRKRPYPPHIMLKIVPYGYMNGVHSSRGIETLCQRDVNFMFLLSRYPAPDHATIGRFRSGNFAECSELMLAQMADCLKELDEGSGEDIYIDVTKLESVANKYTFVWKKPIVNNCKKLWQKLPSLLDKI